MKRIRPRSQAARTPRQRLLHLEHQVGVAPTPSPRRRASRRRRGRARRGRLDAVAGAALDEHAVPVRDEARPTPLGVSATRLSSSLISRGTPTIMLRSLAQRALPRLPRPAAACCRSRLPGARSWDRRSTARRWRRRCGREVRERVARLQTAGVQPGLATVLVGDDPASRVYVGNKERPAPRSGIRSFGHRLPATTSQARAARPGPRRSGARSPTCTASSCSCRCPKRLDAQAGDRGDSAREGRRRPAPGEPGAPAGGAAGAAAVHAARRHAPARRDRRRARRARARSSSGAACSSASRSRCCCSSATRR